MRRRRQGSFHRLWFEREGVKKMGESFLKLLSGKKPDEIIWTADISYWMTGMRVAGQVQPDWETEIGYGPSGKQSDGRIEPAQ